MSDRDTRSDQNSASTAGSDAIARLLQLAGPRPKAPLHARERVRRAAHDQWLRDVTRRRRWRVVTRSGVALALAATLALALGLAPRIGWLDTAEPPVRVAQLRALTGRVTIESGNTTARPLRAGDEVASEAWLETSSQARAALDLDSGGSLRLDRATRIRFLADDAIELERGALYFDSANAATSSGEGAALRIETELGSVRDIGTQFEVRAGEGLRVRVREGMVNLDRGDRVYEAGAGIELRLSASGELSRSAVPVFGSEWDWVLDVARPFTLEGRPLDSFLDWVSRETGWELEYVDPAIATTAPHVELHGSIAGLRPDEALDAVLPTCGLTHRLADGTLLIQPETR